LLVSVPYGFFEGGCGDKIGRVMLIERVDAVHVVRALEEIN
jgi:hypothetical protein